MRQEILDPLVPRARHSGRRTSLPARKLAANKLNAVSVRVGELVLPTYLPAAPDKNPMFLEKRVYQGSSGKVYPLPFTDRVAEKPVDRKWKALWIENEFLRVLILSEIGGRIHAILDKTNGYDLIYNQPVIKPALVGLAGPWVSGGIEFNWPQHHRPATFLPVNFEIEEHSDGSKTIWCCDHDPICRMKGMHGVCLHPGRAYLELKVRAYNRTPFVQTFLWWANLATRAHEAYQSFFPPDVSYVADHARRSMSEYPLAQGLYYGVNYGERGRHGIHANEVPTQFVPPHALAAARNKQHGSRNGSVLDYQPNDLSFYTNIPVPTSYMCVGSQQDFFGGYDHKAQAGLVHIADHHIAPGKKQWTWGNHEFGYAWDRNLTEPDARGEYAPYIEIMAGVYTDNQPDFSFLQPGETKAWSQYWYPIQRIGPAQHANLDAAVSLVLGSKEFRIGVAVTRSFPKAVVRLERANGSAAAEWDVNLAPGKPFVLTSLQAIKAWSVGGTVLRVLDRAGREIISYQPKSRAKTGAPSPATEPPSPREIASADDLFTTGLHLEQYRHATRCPTSYWREALRRDPGDARCNNALGVWHLRRGEFAEAEKLFRRAVERLTQRNANPADGEAYYNLGLCLRYQLDANPKSEIRNPKFADAYAALYKATWNQTWAAASYHALAEMDCRCSDWAKALEHLDRSLRLNTDNTRAQDLMAIVLRRLKHTAEASALLRQTLALDPLDWWARHLSGERLNCDLQTFLDIAHDYARAGFYAEAIELLSDVASPKRCERFSHSPGERAGVRASDTQKLPDQSWGAAPLVEYTLGWLHEQLAVVARASRPFEPNKQRTGGTPGPLRHYRAAAALSPDYCFPARLEEIAILTAAMRANPQDARAPYYLGNLLYDRRRHAEAIQMWERSAKLDPKFSIVWRNLGIGYFNIRKQPAKARASYDRACRANPKDARLLFERDQLWKRLGEKPARRLRELEKRLELVRQRDDLSVEICALYNQTGRHNKALALVSSRNFQPWEGGEGGPLGQWVRSNLMLGRRALAHGAAAKAREYFEAALMAPHNLGEARHLLANQSDVHYWLGCALAELGQTKSVTEHWRVAAHFKGDFQEMKVRAFSEMTYYAALSWKKLGLQTRATKLLRDLLAHAQALQKARANIDYFATSLPTMLLFDDDLKRRQELTGQFLQAQAHLGLGRPARARRLLSAVVKSDPSHAPASDFKLSNPPTA